MWGKLLWLVIPIVTGTIAIVFNVCFHAPSFPEGGQTIHDRLRLDLPASYHTPDTTNTHRFRSLQQGNSGASPNVSAIILNWSRFQNVRDIVTLLCSVDDVISEIVVWNNNHQPLYIGDFSDSDKICAMNKLRIVNSDENVYFQARFIACAESRSPYCFIQDDDYIVRPEIIRALHARIISFDSPRSIHLLPPHEHLSSHSLSGYSEVGDVHTSFAWLGHGAIMHRSLASSFVDLMQSLAFSEQEKKMADNYFTILRNEVPETWVDHGVELGGGDAFTVGTEGDERNRRHIQGATEYLHEMISSGRKHEFVSSDIAKPSNPSVYAPCIGTPCLLSSTTSQLEMPLKRFIPDSTHLLAHGDRNLNSLSSEEKQRYILHSLAAAVDANVESYFMSARDAQVNDSFTLDSTASSGREWASIEMVWVVSTGTAEILSRCKFESSVDSSYWVHSSRATECRPLPSVVAHNITECSIHVVDNKPTPRYFRTTLEDNVKEKWVVHEIWLRGTQ